MISILVLIKHSCPRLWQMVEVLNGALFSLRYPKFGEIADGILKSCGWPNFRLSLVAKDDLPGLEALYRSSPGGYMKYFSPHDFSQTTLLRLYRNPSFLMMKAVDRNSGRLVGYFFLRGFFIGKAFHGLFVSKEFCGQHLGSTMWYVSQHICEQCGIAMYATISKDNQPSMCSAGNGTRLEVLEHLDNNYIYVRCLKNDEADF